MTFLESLNWLDWVLIAFAVLAAAGGAARGVVSMLLALAGAGGAVALVGRFAPDLAANIAEATGTADPSPWVLLTVMCVAGCVGWALGTSLGSAVSRHYEQTWARGLDAFAGAVAGVATVSLIAWYLLNSLVALPTVLGSDWTRGSRISAALDEFVPLDFEATRARFSQFAQASGLPALTLPEGVILDEVAPPAATDVPAVVAAAGTDSTVRILADRSDRCGDAAAGSAVLLGRDLVATNAHVVAGADEVYGMLGGEGRTRPATVVLVDRGVDIAILRIPGIGGDPLTLGPAARREQSVWFAGYPHNHGLTVLPARVEQGLFLPLAGSDSESPRTLGSLALDQALGELSGGSAGIREVIAMRGDVEPGNSGGPVLDADGEVVGLVFAKSATEADRGYALSVDEIDRALTAAATRTTPVPTGPCSLD